MTRKTATTKKKAVKKAPAKAKKTAKVKPKTRDVEKEYSQKDYVAKLRRFANALQKGKRFAIMIGGERVFVPAHAKISIEHERSRDEEEVEFQIKWTK